MLLETVTDGRLIPDVAGHIWGILHWILVGIPFGLLRLFVSVISFVMQILDFSDSFGVVRNVFFFQSRNLFLGFIGGRNGHISNESIAFVFICVMGVYLFFQYLMNKGNFTKKVLHIMLVVMISFFYFGNFRINGERQYGGLFMMNTVSNVVTEISESLMLNIAVNNTGGSLTGENDFARFYEEHILRTTFNFINSGSMDGCYTETSCLDMSMLIPEYGLSGSEWEEFVRARENYIDSIAEYNPFVRRSGDTIVQRSLAVLLGFINSFVLAKPVFFILLTLSGFEILILILLLFVPFALIASLLPWFQNAFFKILKIIIGIMFVPILLTLMLSIIFYFNVLIDNFVLQSASRAMGTLQAMTLGTLPRGNMGLTVYAVMVIVKLVLLRVAWKNKGALLKLITDNKIDDTYINQPTEYLKEQYENIEEKVISVGETVVGGFTGNLEMVQDGVARYQGDYQNNSNFTLDEPVINNVESKEEKEEKKSKENILVENNENENENETTLTNVENDDISDVHVVNPDEINNEFDVIDPVNNVEVIENAVEPTDVEAEMFSITADEFNDNSEFMNKQTTLNGNEFDYLNDLDDIEFNINNEENVMYDDQVKEDFEKDDVNLQDYLLTKDNLDQSASTVPKEYALSFSEEMKEMRELFASD